MEPQHIKEYEMEDIKPPKLLTTSSELLAHTAPVYHYGTRLEGADAEDVKKLRAAMRSLVGKGEAVRVDHAFASKQTLAQGSHLLLVANAARAFLNGEPLMFNGVKYKMTRLGGTEDLLLGFARGAAGSSEKEGKRFAMAMQTAIYTSKLSQLAGQSCYMWDQEHHIRVLAIPLSEKAQRVWEDIINAHATGEDRPATLPTDEE